LEQLKTRGADAVISLDQDQTSLISAFHAELAGAGVDVVLDYLWGRPAELFLQAISQKGLRKAAPRIRFIQIGESAGKNISLPAATLRSSGLALLGSGFGSASLDQIRQALAEFFQVAAKESFLFHAKAVPLAEVETLWDSAEAGTRLVFQP
jgi:NADPH2:quinone reductase